MCELELFDTAPDISKWKIDNFSAENVAMQTARQIIEDKYIGITEVSDKFNRQKVSFQLSKKDCLHRWLKYKEGFSSELVSELLKEFSTKEGDTIMDPFLGSGTTSMVCKIRGINSIGFDILPLSKISIDAKSSVFDYDIKELEQAITEIEGLELPSDYNKEFQYITITDGAFPEQTAKEVVFYSEWNNASIYSACIKNLVTLCIINSLEAVSYTAKDGQYLRWDIKSKKIIEAQEYREKNGRKPLKVLLNKTDIPTLKETLLKELKGVCSDIVYIQKNWTPTAADLKFTLSSALFELPKYEEGILNGVITSPPYCNRYDYTRIYALELNYLGLTTEQVTKMRQSLLSCTVENKSKIQRLQEFYDSVGKSGDFVKIMNIVNGNETLNEIREALKIRNDRGEINNKGVLSMVDGYFTELTFIYYELFRLCRKGAKVAFVNDNVRYAGEVIPVDFLSTEIAEQIGFKPLKIYTLRQQKGNSSQQMSKFGRVALRKSITLWEKV